MSQPSNRPVTIWTAHLKSQEQKAEFEKLLLSSSTTLSRLKEILKQNERDLQASEYKADDFNDPSWSHKQAFRNGQKSVYNELLKLLSFVKETG